MNDPDYILDLTASRLRSSPGSPRQPSPIMTPGAPAISNNHPAVPAENSPRPDTLVGRPWVAIQFKCCRCYNRIYRNRKATAYEGRCPKCGRRIKLKIGNDGTNQRFFEAV